MKFDECAKLFEMDVGGDSHFPHLVHGREPGMAPAPEETLKMLEALAGKDELVTATYDDGTMRFRVDGLLNKTSGGYEVKPVGNFKGVTAVDFNIKDVSRIMTDTRDKTGGQFSVFTIMLRSEA